MCNRGTLDSSFFLFPPNLSSSNWKFSQEHSDFVIFTCAFICFLVAFHKSILKKLPFIFPALLLDRLFVFFLVFFFLIWKMAVQIKFKIQQACMQQNAFRISYYRDHRAWILSGNSEPQPVCLCCLSVDTASIFQVCLPHYSLCIYFFHRLCRANANDFSKQSATNWKKKKKKSIFSKASRLTSANIDG